MATLISEYWVGASAYQDRFLSNDGVSNLGGCFSRVKFRVISVRNDHFVMIYGLSEEHCHLGATHCPIQPNIDDIITILPHQSRLILFGAV